MEALGRSTSLGDFAMFAAGLDAAATAAGGATEWKEWDDATFGTMNFELDLGFDTFFLATADDFMEPLGLAPATSTATANAAAASVLPAPSLAPPSPLAFGDDSCASSYCSSESEASTTADDDDLTAILPVAMTSEACKRSRKRKNPETVAAAAATAAPPMPVAATKKIQEKKPKLTAAQQRAAKRALHTSLSLDPELERVYRRRYDILHEILEAWNTGGIEDMEEIADEVYDPNVTMISPDYSEGLCGVPALMHHWSLLLDAFPDGIMEEYNIERDPMDSSRMNVTWVFSGTQIFPFFGVQPRHEKVTIRGKSFFTFKDEKISQMVLSWNYREALMKLMGVKDGGSGDRR